MRTLALLLLVALALGANAATMKLRWHAPATLVGGGLAQDRQVQHVTRWKGQYPAYYPGIEFSGDWFALVTWCAPDTIGRIAAYPGDACSLEVVGPGEFSVTAGNGVGLNRARPAIVVVP